MTHDKGDETPDNVIPFEEVKRRAQVDAEEEDPVIAAQRAERHVALRAFEEAVGDLADKHGIEAVVVLSVVAHEVPEDPDRIETCHHAVAINFGDRDVDDAEFLLESLADKFDRLANDLLDGTAVAPE